MSFDDDFLSGDKIGIYKAIQSSGKSDRIKMLGAIIAHYYKNDPFLVGVGQFLLTGQKNTSLASLLEKNLLTRIMVDIERMDDPSLTFEKAILLVAERMGFDGDKAFARVQKAYSRGGSGQKQRNLSTDKD